VKVLKGGGLMNKKFVAIIAVVVVVVVIVIAAVVVILPSLFTPPADFSGINLADTRTTDELLPMTLADLSMVADSNDTRTQTVTSDTTSFSITHTSAMYGEATVHIIKAQSASEASDTLDVVFEDDNWYGGASSSTKTNDWFTASKGGSTAFFWRSGIWVFGIEAPNDNLRNDVAQDLVQYLKSL